MERFGVYAVKGKYLESDEVVLGTSGRTRIVFRPGIHAISGVRGHIIRQKQGANGEWCSTSEVNFRHVPADAGVAIELTTAEMRTLFDTLGQLYQLNEADGGARSGKFVVLDERKVVIVDDRTKLKVIKELIDRNDANDFWLSLTRLRPDIAEQLAAATVYEARRLAIESYRDLLGVAGTAEDVWQRFFEQHPWMLEAAFAAPVLYLQGETYVGGKKSTGRNGIGGVATDFLVADQTTNSFAVVEIKKPSTTLIGKAYRGEAGSGESNELYEMSGELSGAVVQARTQVAVAIEHFKSVLGDEFGSLNRVHPRAVLIAGTASTLDLSQMRSFNHFRQGQFGLATITFDELLARLEALFPPTGEM